MKIRRPIFFTSDWHCGHEHIIDFAHRPFKNIDHMHRVLINNFNGCVPQFGVTYFLGDMGLTNTVFLKSIVSQLNGKKIFFLGNHDKKINAMYNIGFDCVLYHGSLVIAGELVTMSHCPLQGIWREDTSKMKNHVPGENWYKENKYKIYSASNVGQFHLHGHGHSPNSGQSEVILDKQWDIGVDGNGYRPVHISSVESWIAKYGK